MMQRLEVAKLGHIALVTPDLEKSFWFWHDVVGLEEVERSGGTVYLRGWGEFEHHSLVLIEGDRARVDHIGWKARRPEDVDAFAEHFKEKGIDIRWTADGSEAGQGKAFRFQVPTSGHTFEIYFEMERPGAPAEKRSRLKNQVYKAFARGISPRRIDHVNIWTAEDPAPTHAWLSEQMGFKMREYIRLKNGATLGGWMSVTPLVHDVGVMLNPLSAKYPGPRLHHVAYYLDNWQDVLRGISILRENGIFPDLGPGQHGISQAFFTYVRDPGSGHRLELFSGGYLIFDPDWEPIEWSDEDLVDGLIWWGEQFNPLSEDHVMNTTTEA
ncbi:MAG: Catechol 2,3-dioxygenase [Hydrogenibacillus schlegelii]|uniref:Catechol 2,3-dioxygenase n=2 Tax=Hydrogenibacillus schlegelii TaxID=1484 RepID=A0A2T5G3U7_HYDSH|nr:MAG: Catechol 2,3-dioxygenase [Hydrogenibacillus schlegelii]